MVKIFLILILIICSTFVYGQNFNQNPAYTGMMKSTHLHGSYNNVGIGSGIGSYNLYDIGFELSPGELTSGFGGRVAINNYSNGINNYFVQFSSAKEYDLGLNNSFRTGVGIDYLILPSLNDEEFPNNPVGISGGLSWNSRQAFAGLAMRNVISKGTDNKYVMQQSYNLHTGYIFDVDKDMLLSPYLIFQYYSPVSFYQMGFNTSMNLFTGGLSFSILDMKSGGTYNSFGLNGGITTSWFKAALLLDRQLNPGYSTLGLTLTGFLKPTPAKEKFADKYRRLF